MNDEKNQSSDKKVSIDKNAFFDAIEVKGLSTRAARVFSKGRAARIIKLISKLFLFTPARIYGLVFLTFGVLTLFFHLGEYYFLDGASVASSLVIGAIFTFLSVFLIISDKPICIALQSVKIIDFIVFDFFSVSRVQKSEEEMRIPAVAGVIFGVLLAVLGFFLPTEYAALVIIGLILLTVAMVSPEFPYLLSLMLFPYVSLIPNADVIFAAIVCLAVISFARKVLIGKRIYYFEIYDFLFLFFILSVYIGNVIVNKGLIDGNALLTLIFALGYIPASNMAVNRRLFDCVSGAVETSAIPIALYSVVRYVSELIFYERTPSRAFFASSEILAVYLSVVVIVALYFSVKRTSIVKKRYYFGVFLLSLLALLTTECFAILVVLLCVAATFFAIKHKAIPSYCIFVVLALPVVLFFLSAPILTSISDALSITPSLTYRREIIIYAFSVFFDNFFFGGVGVAGTFVQNVYLATACRFGIFGLLTFLILLVIRMLHLNVYKRYFSDSTVNFYVEITTLAAVAMLIFGMYFDIFGETYMFYFFVSLFATGSAALRVSKKEKDEKQSYYKDLRRSYSAQIDVFLKK